MYTFMHKYMYVFVYLSIQPAAVVHICEGALYILDLR